MSNKDRLIQLIKAKRSFLCIGLDPDLERLPDSVQKSHDGVVQFCREIIDATHHLAVAFKINLAFFEALPGNGLMAFEQVVSHIPKDCLVIADAKRGDIGNSSRLYAQAFYERYACDALTVAPYMGRDSLQAFLDYDDKWTISLALTSNKGSQDFQKLRTSTGKAIYEEVLEKTASWGSTDNQMFVIGATHPEEFKIVRSIVPDHFLLVPGVGAQGATIADVCRYGINKDVGLLINSSRSIIFAGSDFSFAQAAAQKALQYVLEMRDCTDL